MITAELLFSKFKETLDSPVGLVTGKFKSKFAVEKAQREKPARSPTNRFNSRYRPQLTFLALKAMIKTSPRNTAVLPQQLLISK